MTKLDLAISAAAVLGLATACVLQHRTNTELREQNRALQPALDQLARLSMARQASPPRPGPVPTSEAVSEAQVRELLRFRGEAALLRRQKDELEQLRSENHGLRTNLLAQVLTYGPRPLSGEEMNAYLEQNRRSAASLVVAYGLARDPALLQEAVERFPNDPRVSLAAASARPPLEPRRQRIEAFKQSDPGNALANYLAAQDYFKSGQTAMALQELAAAAGKPRFQDYAGDFLRDAEEAYDASGYPKAAAQAAAWHSLALPAVDEMARLRQSLDQLVASCREAGDEPSAHAAIQFGLRLGQRLADEPLDLKTEGHELVGVMIQRRLLETMDPASSYDSGGRTVKDRLDELARRRADIRSLQDPELWDGYVLRELSEAELIGYFERLKASGELEARRWALSRQRNP